MWVGDACVRKILYTGGLYSTPRLSTIPPPPSEFLDKYTGDRCHPTRMGSATCQPDRSGNRMRHYTILILLNYAKYLFRVMVAYCLKTLLLLRFKDYGIMLLIGFIRQNTICSGYRLNNLNRSCRLWQDIYGDLRWGFELI